MMKKTTVTRSSTDVFLIGNTRDTFPGNRLPLTIDVMKYLHHRKNLPEWRYKPIKTVISCHMISGQKFAKCFQDGGCCAETSRAKCVIAAIKHDGKWLKSGLPMVSDFTIRERLTKLNETWVKLNKARFKEAKREIEKRGVFREMMGEFFDLTAKDAEKIIKSDRLRSADAKEEDVQFLADQRVERKMKIGKLDKIYELSVMKKVKRDSVVIARSLRARKFNLTSCEQDIFNNDFPTSDTDIDDNEYECQSMERPRKRPRLLTLQVSRNNADQ